MAVILFTALVLSHSRMGIISALMSTLVIVTLIATLAKQRRIRTVFGIAFLAAGILMTVWIGPGALIARFEALPLEYAPGQSRLAIWLDTLHLIDQYPWLGTGFGTFPVAYKGSQTAYPNAFVAHVHNDYLEILSELGFLGGLLLFGSIFYVLLRSMRRFHALEDPFERGIALGCTGSLVALVLHSFTDFNLYIPADALVLFCVMAMGLSGKGFYEDHP